MLLFTPQPIIPGQSLPDVKADYRSAKKIGYFRVSDLAVYPPDGTFLLRSSILDIVRNWGSAHVTGCCAGGVPVPRLVITTESKKIPLLCGNEATADALAAELNPRK